MSQFYFEGVSLDVRQLTNRLQVSGQAHKHKLSVVTKIFAYFFASQVLFRVVFVLCNFPSHRDYS